MGTGIIDPAFVDNRVIFGALIGAISWNLITWYYGIPSSSSHALIGGMIGVGLGEGGHRAAALARHSEDRAFIFISPLLGLVLGALIMLACPGFSSGKRRGAWTAGFAACNSFRLRPTASATAATTRRRRWASSGCS